MSVSSEDLLAFIKTQTELEITRDQHGAPEFTNTPLEGEALARALVAVKDLVEIEKASEASERGHELHAKVHEDSKDRAQLAAMTSGETGQYM